MQDFVDGYYSMSAFVHVNVAVGGLKPSPEGPGAKGC